MPAVRTRPTGRRPARRRSGSGAKTIIWWALIAMLVVAVVKMFPDPSPPAIHAWLSGQTGSVQDKVTALTGELNDVIASADPNAAADGSSPGTAGPAGEYNRDDWNHWIDVRSCWTVREQVLARDAVPGSLVMLDENSRPTSNVDRACAIESGRWVDPYSGDEFTDPSDLDIDHVAPLAWTADHGGNAWSPKRKQKYANDLTYPQHLLATSASENRSKGAAGPADYRPPNEAFWCEYGTAWTHITDVWDLTVDDADQQAINELLARC